MNLIWKLLRSHISKSQLSGFFLANLLGLTIVLLGYQFYTDVLPCFVGDDGFMANNNVVLTKKVRSSSVVSGESNLFDDADIEELRQQPFVESLGKCTSNDYHATATMSVGGTTILNSEVFFESVPNEFVGVDHNVWQYNAGDEAVPVLLPRSYLTMYNFGFAKSRSLPTLSEGVLGMVDIALMVQGNGKQGVVKGKLIGFSNKINSILVPQSFMELSNQEYGSQSQSNPSRVLVRFDNPASKEVTTFIEDHGYEIDSDQMNNEKTAYFLKLAVGIVMTIGVLISALSFYILLLSIFLLVQKNTHKLENLLLIGYPVRSVALPYQVLAMVLNGVILLIAIIVVLEFREFYYEYLLVLQPALDKSFPGGMLMLGVGISLLVSVVNSAIIHNRIKQIWYTKRRSKRR